MKLELITALNRARQARQAAIVVTETASGAARLIREPDGFAGDPLHEELAQRFRSGASGMVTTADGVSHFLTVHLPPPRLVVIGAVHISQALAPMAKLAGFDTTIIDPRSRRSATIRRSTTARSPRRSRPAASMSAPSAAGRPMPSGSSGSASSARARRGSPRSMRRSASRSGPSRRPRSPSRCWPR